MKYCRNCGKQIDDKAVICVHCGVMQQDIKQVQDDGGGEWALLSFFIPVAGLILYLLWKDEKPKTAKQLWRGLKIVLILYAVFIGIYFLLIFLAILMAFIGAM